MERDTLVSIDVESTPLQIKTNSTAGSGDKIRVDAHKENNVFFAQVVMIFNSTIRYYINKCIQWTDFPVKPPQEVDKIWTIRKTITALIIECNGVEVLNYQFSDSSLNKCVDYWGKDVWKKIKFSNAEDTASISYRAKPGKFPSSSVTIHKAK